MTSIIHDVDRKRLLYVIRHKGKLPGERAYPHVKLAPDPIAREPRRPWWRFWKRRPEPTVFQRCLMVHIAGNRPTSALR